MTMIEKVAKALYLADNPSGDWNTTLLQNTYKVAAKAALAAMKEPTDEMLDASKDADYIYSRSHCKEIYKPMIEAALKE